jgi:hypothetical protein
MDRYLENMLHAMSRLTMKDNCRVKGQDQGVGWLILRRLQRCEAIQAQAFILGNVRK